MKNKEVILSGILMGISGIFARMAMIVAGHSYELQDFLFNPLLWVSWAFGLVGFGYLQLALYKHNVSFVGPVVSSIAITTPVILAVVVLNEHVSPLRWVGVGLIILGVLAIGQSEKPESLLERVSRKGLPGLVRTWRPQDEGQGKHAAQTAA
jgi:multidrug transporter EmrE-like cation transporter